MASIKIVRRKNIQTSAKSGSLAQRQGHPLSRNFTDSRALGAVLGLLLQLHRKMQIIWWLVFRAGAPRLSSSRMQIWFTSTMPTDYNYLVRVVIRPDDKVDFATARLLLAAKCVEPIGDIVVRRRLDRKIFLFLVAQSRSLRATFRAFSSP